jgi:hypothetical protein
MKTFNLLNRLPLLGFVVSVGFLTPAPLHAGSVSLTCPETLDVAETAPAPTEWEVAIASGAHTFSRLSIYDGKPHGQAALQPDNGDERTTIYRWILGDAAGDLWVECAYKKTNATVVRHLDKGLHVCNAYLKEATTSLTCE